MNYQQAIKKQTGNDRKKQGSKQEMIGRNKEANRK